MRVLQDIDIVDDVLANCDESEVNLRSFIFHMGTEGHDFIYDVGLRHIYYALILLIVTSFSTL